MMTTLKIIHSTICTMSTTDRGNKFVNIKNKFSYNNFLWVAWSHILCINARKKTPCRLGQGVGYEDGMLLA